MKRHLDRLIIASLLVLGALVSWPSAQQFNDVTARRLCVGAALSSCTTVGSVKVTLTALQVKALHTTPITLVSAPGSGKVVIVDDIVFGATFVSAAYTGSNNLEFRYTDGSGTKVTADIAAATLNFSTGTKYGSVTGVTTELTALANAAVVVAVPVANPAAGDSPINFSVFYRVVTLP